MKKAIFAILVVLFYISCSKTEKPSSDLFIQEDSIKFSSNLDTGTYKVNDTLPLIITLSSKLPASGVTYSIISTWVDSSLQIFKLDTILNNSILKLNIPGHNKKGNYSIFINVTSKNNISNNITINDRRNR